MDYYFACPDRCSICFFLQTLWPGSRISSFRRYKKYFFHPELLECNFQSAFFYHWRHRYDLYYQKETCRNVAGVDDTLFFFMGVFFTGFGSAWYHLDPGNKTLIWDRLPMPIAFISFFSVIIGEHIDIKWGKILLWPFLLTGLLFGYLLELHRTVRKRRPPFLRAGSVFTYVSHSGNSPAFQINIQYQCIHLAFIGNVYGSKHRGSYGFRDL